MAGENPQEGVGRYQIGEKLRALRLRRKMGLADLSRETGLSSAMLSKLERGRLFPTLPTLYRIATAFDVGLDHFFGSAARTPAVYVTRRSDRIPAARGASGDVPPHRIEEIPFGGGRAHLYCAEFEPRTVAPSDRHAHAGAELLFVMTGRLLVSFEDADYTLESGDAIYFESHQPHGYCRQGHDRCTAMMLTTPMRDES